MDKGLYPDNVDAPLAGASVNKYQRALILTACVSKDVFQFPVELGLEPMGHIRGSAPTRERDE
jgi:hypothetical protein